MIALLLLLILKSAGTVSADWSVTFENPNPCALKGSSVEFRCSYSYPAEEIVRGTAWSKGYLKEDKWTRIDLSDLPSYKNRSEYLGDHQHNCSLVIHDLQDDDAGYYYFRFDTKTYGRRSKRSVFLSVSELTARVPHRVKAGESVTLDCQTSCQLPGAVWFKDGQRVAKPEFQARVEDAGNYACAVKGQEAMQSDPVALHVQYSPLNVSVEVSPPGLLTEGSSVNLTCSSEANPAAQDYIWYRVVSSSSPLLQVGSGQVLSLASVEASHTGLYLCQARNQLGENNSTKALLTVQEETNINHFIFLVGTGIKVFFMLLLPLVIIWVWKKWRKSADKEQHCHDYENVIPTQR